MSIIKIEFPADQPAIARELGEALLRIASSETSMTYGAPTELPTAAEIEAKLSVYTGSESALDAQTDGGPMTEEELSTDPLNVDENCVPFHGDYCAKAVDPFYKTGPQAGQWKRKKGVEQSAYDSWYADALALATINPSSDEVTAEEQVDTGAAFGGDATPEPEVTVPHDAGTLMAWVAEMQTAARLTQENVNAAYTQLGLSMPDIFPSPDNTPELIAERVGLIHNLLSSWA